MPANHLALFWDWPASCNLKCVRGKTRMQKLRQLKAYPPINSSTGWGAGSNDKKNEQPGQAG